MPDALQSLIWWLKEVGKSRAVEWLDYHNGIWTLQIQDDGDIREATEPEYEDAIRKVLNAETAH